MGFFRVKKKGPKPGCKKPDFFRYVMDMKRGNIITLFTVLKNSTALA